MQRFYRHFDRDGSGVVTFKEFEARLNAVIHNHQAAAQGEDELLRVLRRIANASGVPTGPALAEEFRRMDTNNSGRLSRGELRRALQRWGVDLTSDEVQVRNPATQPRPRCLWRVSRLPWCVSLAGCGTHRCWYLAWTPTRTAR